MVINGLGSSSGPDVTLWWLRVWTQGFIIRGSSVPMKLMRNRKYQCRLVCVCVRARVSARADGRPKEPSRRECDRTDEDASSVAQCRRCDAKHRFFHLKDGRSDAAAECIITNALQG